MKVPSTSITGSELWLIDKLHWYLSSCYHTNLTLTIFTLPIFPFCFQNPIKTCLTGTGILKKRLHHALTGHLTGHHLKAQHKKPKNTAKSPGDPGSHQETVRKRRICGGNELYLAEVQHFPVFYKRLCQSTQSFLYGLILIYDWSTRHQLWSPSFCYIMTIRFTVEWRKTLA